MQFNRATFAVAAGRHRPVAGNIQLTFDADITCRIHVDAPPATTIRGANGCDPGTGRNVDGAIRLNVHATGAASGFGGRCIRNAGDLDVFGGANGNSSINYNNVFARFDAVGVDCRIEQLCMSLVGA